MKSVSSLTQFAQGSWDDLLSLPRVPTEFGMNNFGHVFGCLCFVFFNLCGTSAHNAKEPRRMTEQGS